LDSFPGGSESFSPSSGSSTVAFALFNADPDVDHSLTIAANQGKGGSLSNIAVYAFGSSSNTA
jgi:hypothetical protein